MALGQAQDADTGAEALFGMRPGAQYAVDQGLGIGAIGRGLAADPFKGPTGVTAVRRGHVFGHRGVAPVAGAAHMRCHPSAFMKDLDRAFGNPRPKLLFGQGMGHGIVMLGDLDMVIQTGAALLPFSVLVGLRRQWL